MARSASSRRPGSVSRTSTRSTRPSRSNAHCAAAMSIRTKLPSSALAGPSLRSRARTRNARTWSPIARRSVERAPSSAPSARSALSPCRFANTSVMTTDDGSSSNPRNACGVGCASPAPTSSRYSRIGWSRSTSTPSTFTASVRFGERTASASPSTTGLTSPHDRSQVRSANRSSSTPRPEPITSSDVLPATVSSAAENPPSALWLARRIARTTAIPSAIPATANAVRTRSWASRRRMNQRKSATSRPCPACAAHRCDRSHRRAWRPRGPPRRPPPRRGLPAGASAPGRD